MTGQVRTVDGRVAGRGQETRQKLLDCLSEMLSSSPYRDVKVIDVARRAGPRHHLLPVLPRRRGRRAGARRDHGGGERLLSELVEGRSWSGRAGWQTAQELVDGFLEFWRKHDAILRVVDLGAAEGDKRFSKIRLKVLNAVEGSLAEAVSELQAKGRIDKDVNPGAIAGSLVAMLAAVASHQKVSPPGASSRPRSNRTWRCWCTWGSPGASRPSSGPGPASPPRPRDSCHPGGGSLRWTAACRVPGGGPVPMVGARGRKTPAPGRCGTARLPAAHVHVPTPTTLEESPWPCPVKSARRSCPNRAWPRSRWTRARAAPR